MVFTKTSWCLVIVLMLHVQTPEPSLKAKQKQGHKYRLNALISWSDWQTSFSFCTGCRSTHPFVRTLACARVGTVSVGVIISCQNTRFNIVWRHWFCILCVSASCIKPT